MASDSCFLAYYCSKIMFQYRLLIIVNNISIYRRSCVANNTIIQCWLSNKLTKKRIRDPLGF